MPQQLPSELLGYDRAITVFSPDGRLLQVEYARKTVSQGTTVIGLVCKDGVVFVADKRTVYKLIVPETVEKIFQLDEHIGGAISGLTSDGRVLIERAQKEAQKYKLTYDEKIDVPTLTREICNYKQLYTQFGGARPFGVSLLIGGVDDTGKRLFFTEPSGTFFEYKAVAIGEGAEAVNKFLEDNYNENMTCEEGIKLGLKALKKFVGQKFNIRRVEIAIIPEKTKKFRKLTRKEIEKYLKKK